jgi:microcystin-dependent protein
MATPFLAEIRIVSFNFAPKGWALCNGQLLPINQNQALFSLLGTTYGGNGQTTFALPNFQGRVPMHWGNSFAIGQTGGEAAHTLTISELPAHVHSVAANNAAVNQGSPANNYPGNPGQAIYSNSLDSALSSGTVAAAGGSQPHENLPPYLALNFVIALQGIFPSQN